MGSTRPSLKVAHASVLATAPDLAAERPDRLAPSSSTQPMPRRSGSRTPRTRTRPGSVRAAAPLRRPHRRGWSNHIAAPCSSTMPSRRPSEAAGPGARVPAAVAAHDRRRSARGPISAASATAGGSPERRHCARRSASRTAAAVRRAARDSVSSVVIVLPARICAPNWRAPQAVRIRAKSRRAAAEARETLGGRPSSNVSAPAPAPAPAPALRVVRRRCRSRRRPGRCAA